MIQFNLVFTKHLLSAATSFSKITQSHIHCQSKKTLLLKKQNICGFCVLIFHHFAFKYLARDWMNSRCPLLALLFICVHVVVAKVGGHDGFWQSDLMGHTSAVKPQMRWKGGLTRMAASSICITCVSGGCSLTYRPLVAFISKEHKVPTDTSASTFKT